MPPKGFLGWLQSNRDGLIGTFLVAVVLCLACSAMVSVAAVSLRDTQLRNKEVDRKKNILLAAGLCESGAKASEVDAIYADRIRESLIDLDTGEPETSDLVDGASYDPRKAAKDPALSEPISNGSLAGIARREKFASVYEIVEGGQTQGFIFPIYGKGLWSTLYGFIALEADGQTVRGITFYEHAETPGLGG
ncbi:MAG: NADH:ubiquinone reductase (Na(+)-transporting) subunit C, partial [Planctomycetota bacterium]